MTKVKNDQRRKLAELQAEEREQNAIPGSSRKGAHRPIRIKQR